MNYMFDYYIIDLYFMNYSIVYYKLFHELFICILRIIELYIMNYLFVYYKLFNCIF